ncbi:MAG: hypothetical protein ACXWPM_06095 [Bdellovibrionota bacterium]
MFTLLLSALISVHGSFAASSGVAKSCALPRGEVEQLSNQVKGASGRWITALRPAEDCQSVLIWTYDSERWASYSASENTCAEFQSKGGAEKYPGLSRCRKIPVFASEEDGKPRALPYGVVSDTTLVIHEEQSTRNYLMNSAGTHVLELSRGTPARSLASEGPAVTRSKKSKRGPAPKYVREVSLPVMRGD